MKKSAFLFLAALLVQPFFCGPSSSAVPEAGWPAFDGDALILGADNTFPTPAASVNDADGRLFPEDGSMPMAAWYTDMGHAPSPGLKAALAGEGVELRDMKFQYDWVQDIALFSRSGALVLQAEMPLEILKDMGLTMGVLNDDEMLTAASETSAANIGAAHRRMKWTFLEGGGLITGSFSDGSPYAIVTPAPVEGARKLYQDKTGAAIDAAQARRLVAEDLGVTPDDLFVIPASRHMDLFISPLKGGTLLLSDPAKTAGVLKQLLAGRLQAGERERLSGILELYEKGFQPVYSAAAPPDIAGKPMGSRQFVYDHYETDMLDAVEKVLSGRFKIVRAAGVFMDLGSYANSAEGRYIRDGINFFNGFTGSGRAGNLFQITNGTGGLTALENYWRSVMAAQGVTPERVYFPGSYGFGAGLDCQGAPSGK
jgi:hypothetical protein